MTLSNTVVRVQYNGDGNTASFTVTFPFWDADDLTVILTDANGSDTTWVRGTQYTVSGGDGSTGTVSVETTPTDYTPASGETLTILSALTLTQDVSLPLGGALPSADVEQRLDKNVRLIQQMDEKLDRAVLLPESSSNTDLTIPDPVADNLLRWKDDLSGLENVAASSATILSQLNDSDNDTIINVEESADEDIIRFDIAGAERGDWNGTRFRIQDIVEIHSSDNTLSALHFGDPEDADVGRITYDHSGNVMRVWLAAGIEGRWDTTGLSIGQDVAPDGPLHIGAGLAGAVTANPNGDELIVEGAGHTGISILSPTANRSSIFFGNPSSSQRSEIRHEGTTEGLNFSTHLTDRLNIGSSETVFNDPGNAYDFRVETDTITDAFLVDGSADLVTIGAGAGFQWKHASGNFTAKTETVSGMNGTDPMLSIAADDSSDLKAYFAEYTDAGGPGTRLWVWDDAQSVPDLPHTSIKPAFAVWGDILVGDIIAIESNPMTYFMRQNTGLAVSAVTQFFSARNINNDTDGGAGIVMAPDDGASADSGNLRLIAYGHGGGGGLENTIRLATRSGVGTLSDRVHITEGVRVGSPTGGDKGAGTLNANAVYDDNTLLTCYVFDQAIDGLVDTDKWDTLVPDRKNIEGELIEERSHEPLRKFAARIGTDEDPLDIDKYAAHWKSKRHLTSMPNEKKFDPVKGMSSGEWIQRLVETVEIQAVHIEQLNQRVKDLEAKVV